MNSFFLILTGVVGVLSTFYVNTHLKQGAVRASALLSFVVAIFFHWFPYMLNQTLTTNIPVVFIGASFIGMVSNKVVNNYITLVVAGVIFSIIFLNTSNFFTGYGGALGTSACISLLTAMSLPLFLSRKKISNGILLLRRFLIKKK